MICSRRYRLHWIRWRRPVAVVPCIFILACTVISLIRQYSQDFNTGQRKLSTVDIDSEIKSITPWSNSSMVTSLLSTEDGLAAEDAISILENSLVRENQTGRCRKTLQHLWTKSIFAYRSFPSCPSLLRAVLSGSLKNQRPISDAVKWTIPEPHDYSSILAMLKTCQRFLRMVDVPDQPASDEEAQFPLAYVFVPYRNPAQTIRLFRMIYQPQNAYCITYDTQSNVTMQKIIQAMASCFPSNVYLNPNPEPIYYSTFTLLHSVMSCVDVLRRSRIKWRYVQVVSWNDFPLKTNYEMVKIFKALNGSQDCELGENGTPEFVAFEHNVGSEIFSRRHTVLRPIPPGGLTFYKGSFSTTMTREFADFMFTNPISVQYFNYLNGSQFPDEFYWPTLIHNIQLNPPGGFPGQCLVFYRTLGTRKPFISRFQVWKWDDEKCSGTISRSSCVFGVRDLGMLMRRVELFAHKLYDEFHPALHYCLEDWYWRMVCMGNETGLDVKYYQNLPSVKYHNLPASAKENYVCSIPPT